MTTPLPGVKVEVAFVTNPYSSSLVWTDITQWVLSVKTTLGRNYETDHNETSIVSLLVRNDGRFNPLNSGSPYWPNVLPFRPVRVTALYQSGSWPVWYGFVNSWPQTWTNQRGVVQLAGVDAFKAVLGFVPGDPYDVKVRKDYNVYTGSGASSADWDFYPFDVASGSGFNSERAGGPPLILPGAGIPMPSVVTPAPCRAAAQFTGAQGLSGSAAAGLQGEVFFNLAAGLSTPGASAWLVSSGTAASGSIGMFPAANGSWPLLVNGMSVAAFLNQQPPNLMPNDNSASFETSVADWTASGACTIAQTTAEGVDGSASMRITSTSASAAMWAELNEYAPATAGAKYSLSLWAATNNPSSTTFAAQADFYDASHTLIGNAQFCSTAAFGGPTAFMQFSGTVTAPANTAYLRVKIGWNGSSNLAAGYYVDVDALMLTETVSPVPVYRAPSAGTPAAQFIVAVASATSGDVDIYNLPVPTLDVWHHLAWVPAQVGTPLVVLDGVTQTATSTVPFAAGTSANQTWVGCQPYSTTFTGGLRGMVTGLYLAQQDTGVINNVSQPYAAQHYNYGTTAAGAARTHDFASETTSQRVLDVATAVGLPSAMVSVETGLTTMSASGDVSGTAATALLEAAADTELGNVFIDQSGVLTFHNRDHRNSPSIVATFGEDTGAGEIPYEGDVQVDYDDQYIYNDVQVSQNGATPAYTFETQDITSQNTYGVRTLQVSPSCASQADVQGMAATLLARYKNPLPRVSKVSVELRGKPQYMAQVLALNIGDAVTVNRRPVDAPAFSFDAFVDGITHTVDQGQWTVQLMLTPLYPNSTY